MYNYWVKHISMVQIIRKDTIFFLRQFGMLYSAKQTVWSVFQSNNVAFISRHNIEPVLLYRWNAYLRNIEGSILGRTDQVVCKTASTNCLGIPVSIIKSIIGINLRGFSALIWVEHYWASIFLESIAAISIFPWCSWGVFRNFSGKSSGSLKIK